MKSVICDCGEIVSIDSPGNYLCICKRKLTVSRREFMSLPSAEVKDKKTIEPDKRMNSKAASKIPE